MKIYHVPGTRSVRPIWLCYELGLSVDIEIIDFSPKFRDSESWRAISPTGKVPALEDGTLTMFESGAMIDHILARYGEGRLHPEPGTAESAIYRQWCWFAEATLIRPLGLYRVLRARDEPVDELVDEAVGKFRESLAAVESALIDKPFLLGKTFSAADIMMGYSISLIERYLNERHPNLSGYLDRLRSRDAYLQVSQLTGT